MLGAVLASSLHLQAAVQDSPTPAVLQQGRLEPGAPREVEITAGIEHAWTIGLEAGHVYEVDVDQGGANVEVAWTADGEARKVNEKIGWSGRETALWVAKDGGTTTFTVRTATRRSGRYRIALEASRPATDSDRERHGAEKALRLQDVGALRNAADWFAAQGLTERATRALRNLAYLAGRRGESARARQAAEECVTAARAAALEENLSQCLMALASRAESTGEVQLARVAYGEALAIVERRGEPGPIGTALHDLGTLLVRQGEFEEAQELQRRAAGRFAEAGDDLGAAIVQSSLAAIAGYRGDLETALAGFESALSRVRRQGRTDQEVVLSINVGVAYGQLGDIDRSIARLREAVALAEKGALKPMVAFARLALGAEYEDAGDLEAAAREIEAAGALAREVGNQDEVANGEGLLGWTLARQGKSAAAEERLAVAVASAREGGSPLTLAVAYLYQGKARLLAGRLQDAEEPLLQAQSMFAGFRKPDDEGRAWAGLARYSLAKGDLEAASDRAAKAVHAFESVRARVALADQRARYFAFRREAYDVAVAALVERDRRQPGQGHLARAFEMTERARARALLEEVRARRHPEETAGAPARARRRQAALDRMGHLQRELVAAHTSAKPDGEGLARLEREVEVATAEEEAARRAIRDASPRPRGESVVSSSVELARRLAPDEAVLEYHVAPESSWLFVLRPEGLTVFPLPGEAALRKAVDTVRQLLTRPRRLGSAAYATAARRLHEVVVAPAHGELAGVRRLRVVPDGPLWEIPFEALVTDAPSAARYADLPYLLRRFTVSYQPSASAALEGGARTAGGPDLVAFADPRLPPGRPDGETVARVERAVFRAGDRWSLPALPCAGREARDAAALFPAGRARVHVGDEARESRVKADSDVARARYLLFSTHALLSETMPSQSALVLTLGADGVEDGLLQVHEIEGLDLSADLVVLSACESALGPNLRGEGLLGLARAFFHAGARGLVATQWKVADCSTAALSTEFFRGLEGPRAKGPAEALRGAKLHLLRGPAYAHPYYWAPFVLIGATGGRAP